MDDLKPCPFCGGKAILVESIHAQVFKVECMNTSCYCFNTSTIFSNKTNAIEAWNRRTNDVEIHRC